MTSRRTFLGQSAAAAAFTLASCSGKKQPAILPPDPLTPPLPTAPKKKGLGITTKSPVWADRLTKVNAQRFYSWNHAIPTGVPSGTHFIPMLYRQGPKTQSLAESFSAIKQAGITELLGFNEPDAKPQGNMTVEQSLAAWPLLMESGLRLGSPSCVHPDKEWMLAFMDGVKKNQLRVDFVCVHSYGGPNPDALIKRLENVHKLFQRPIWITEFGCGDWEAKSAQENKHRPETVLRFMEKVLPMLEKLDYLERYAWFPASTTSASLGTSALFQENGELTRLGQCYRDLS